VLSKPERDWEENMEEKNENITNEPVATKTETKKAKPADKKKKSSFSAVVADHKGEFKKIVWAKPAEVVKKTGAVIVVSLFLGAVIFGMDSVFTGLQSLVIKLLS